MNMTTKSEQLALSTVADPRWAEVVGRDPEADGRFFYSVRTTGVYCRPSCSARTPRPENVAFHASADEARQAGFRPCLRPTATQIDHLHGRQRPAFDSFRQREDLELATLRIVPAFQ